MHDSCGPQLSLYSDSSPTHCPATFSAVDLIHLVRAASTAAGNLQRQVKVSKFGAMGGRGEGI